MSIKAVFFDIGRVVLVDSAEKPFREKLSKFLGIEYEKVEPKIGKIIDQLVKGRITEKEFWTKLFQTFNMKPKKNYEKFIMKEFCDNWTLNTETVKIVKSVKAAGYKIAAISDTIQPHVEYMKKKGWYEPFPVLILSSEVGMKKPEVGIYRMALKKLKVKADESIFIDDKEKNLVTAEKLGMKTILFKNVKQLKKDLMKFGVEIRN
jgi:putative hydrolase of the HAD superfamily